MTSVVSVAFIISMNSIQFRGNWKACAYFGEADAAKQCGAVDDVHDGFEVVMELLAHVQLGGSTALHWGSVVAVAAAV
eukprot:CAMPEP_0184558330 /NCGR_PEP_ID=MMETSP0199_2-20130426/45175_1 /TAXON_ID=1112570 /ORGANISM="Thraustochytrium sp., Strain LLF1b" /LENGTH=77 /DNA_ID=CAMNT_0026955509 /DNA_START=248 /DNA_END=479 /DNA_ORIENTATION=-